MALLVFQTPQEVYLVVGNGGVNRIDYITIATTGNATDLWRPNSTHRYYIGLSNATRGVFAVVNISMQIVTPWITLPSPQQEMLLTLAT
jgi:hypothetical protein